MIPNRFWGYVDKDSSPDGCWLWTASKVKGYGQFRVNGQMFLAHRLVGIDKFGEDACEGMLICHSCDNPACVNPNHLWLGTNADNMSDMVAKGRAAYGDANGSRKYPERLIRGEDHLNHKYPERVQGENNGKAKLTEKQVLEIRRRYRPKIVGGSKSNAKKLAEEFGVDVNHIRLIGRKKFWKHL